MTMRRASLLLVSLAAGCGRPDLPPDLIGSPVGDNNDMFPQPRPFTTPPQFGPITAPAVPPPPLSGGTLRVLRDGKTAIAADPDRDTIWIVDLAAQKVLHATPLESGDQPGRVVEDGAGIVHVALRGGGAIADLVPGTWAATRRTACAAPRGLAWEPATDRLHVACAGGELVSLPAAGGAAVRTLQIAPDLRDVVVDAVHPTLWLTRFRSAELLELDGSGAIVRRGLPGDVVSGNDTFQPEVAWRAIAHPAGGIVVSYQRALQGKVLERPGGYANSGGGCGSIVHGTVGVFKRADTQYLGPTLPDAVLPVDVALDRAAQTWAIVAAGNALNPGSRRVILGRTDAGPGCAPLLLPDGLGTVLPIRQPTGQPTAIDFDGQDRLIVQTREPATIQILSDPAATIALPGASRADSGHEIFHANSGAQVACASCHPEGGEDGRVWEFVPSGPRRTQSLRGGILGTEPFHWDGDMADFPTLAHEVFQGRMSGPPLTMEQHVDLARFIDRIPLLPRAAPADPAAVRRGEAEFTSAGCAGCHSGPKYTSNANADVGTGGSFQVARLSGLATHPPFLHDGCAATLADRFSPRCDSIGAHGATAHLTAAQLADLLAYLDTL